MLGNRKSLRLSSYNYASPGMYFVTICTQNREYLFADVVNVVGAAPTLKLQDIVHRFKSLTTARYHKQFSGKLWQRGYHDQIIRNENELNDIRQYIENNPTKWFEDPEYVNT